MSAKNDFSAPTSSTVRTGCTTLRAENAVSAASIAAMRSGMVRRARTSGSLRSRGMDLIQYHDDLRKEDVPTMLAGLAAVLPVVSIAGFEIVLGAAILSMIVLRVKPRWPPIWLPISLFILGTVISWLASSDLRGGLPQIKKFYVYAMVFVVVSTFRNVAQIRWLALGWAAAATASAGLGLYQFYDKYEDAMEKHQTFYDAYVADRITGFLDHWMTFSGEMMMALLIIASTVFFCRDRRWVAWLVAAGALIGIALVAAE